MNTIIAYDAYRTYVIISKKDYSLGDIIDGGKIVYAIINDDGAYIATVIYGDGDIVNGMQHQTIAYHNRQYYDSVAAPTHIEYRKYSDDQYHLYNGDTEDVCTTVPSKSLLNQIRNDLTCLLMGEETKHQTKNLELYDQGYANNAIRNGKVVYTEWIQRPIK